MRNGYRDSSARNLNGSGDGADDKRAEPAAAGEGNYFRLCVYVAEGGVYACAAFHVSSAGVSSDTACGFHKPQEGGLRDG